MVWGMQDKLLDIGPSTTKEGAQCLLGTGFGKQHIF